MDALEADEESTVDIGEEEEDEQDETVLAVGHDVTIGALKRRTMKLCGKIGKTEVLILVDSGSVGTFISQQLASRISKKPIKCHPTNFVAATGGPMTCSQKIKDLEWTLQGYVFMTTVGILPLKCFYMILGQDWFEECSPMWIHWAKMVMRFTHQGTRI